MQKILVVCIVTLIIFFAPSAALGSTDSSKTVVSSETSVKVFQEQIEITEGQEKANSIVVMSLFVMFLTVVFVWIFWVNLELSNERRNSYSLYDDDYDDTPKKLSKEEKEKKKAWYKREIQLYHERIIQHLDWKFDEKHDGTQDLYKRFEDLSLQKDASEDFDTLKKLYKKYEELWNDTRGPGGTTTV